jgi:PKD domain
MGRSGQGLTLGAAVAIVVLLVIGALSVGPASPSRLATLSSGAPRPSEGESQLALAQSSLQAGAGPAVGAHDFQSDVTPLSSSPTYSWTNLTGSIATAPSSRFAAMTWDAADGYVLLFGGETVLNSSARIGPLADTWTYVNGTWTNITGLVVGSPPPTVGATMAYYPPGGSVILFGGANATTQVFNSTWSFHADVWTNLTTSVGPAPSAREVPAIVYDTTASELVLTGGAAGDSAPQGTWVFKNTTWTNVTSTAPIPANSIFPALANDPSQGGVLMVTLMSYSSGGIHPPYYTGSFLYSGGTWENLTPLLSQHPPTIVTPILNYLSPTEGIILSAGVLANPEGDQVVVPTMTWQYLNGGWTNLTAVSGAAPLPREFAASAVDPVDESVILFGGDVLPQGVTDAETWAYSAPPSVNASVTPAYTDVGIPVNLSSHVTLGLSPNRVSWNFGDGSTSGATNPTHTYSSPGLYGPVATATDFAGQIGAGAAAIVVAAAPSVTITAIPESPVAGSSAGFTASVTGGTAPYSIQWILGDGTSASGSTVSHIYSKAQTYNVQVTVTDQWGSKATANLTVVVGAGSASSGNSSGLSSGTSLLLIAVIVILAVLAAVFAVLWMRKPRSPTPPVPFGAAPPPPP